MQRSYHSFEDDKATREEHDPPSYPSEIAQGNLIQLPLFLTYIRQFLRATKTFLALSSSNKSNLPSSVRCTSHQ